MFIVHKHLARIMASGVYVTLLLVAAVLAGGKFDYVTNFSLKKITKITGHFL